MEPAPTDVSSHRAVRWAGLALAIVTLAAYANTFSLPFIFDDHPSITGNPTIQSFTTALSPPTDGRAVTGRPIVNLSLALNHALGGAAPAGYHVFNFLVHLASALLLFGVAWRTFLRASPSGEGRTAIILGSLVAILWALHPLQTESVTFVIQRTESLVGLFYLLTLYAFVRGTDPVRPGGWFVVSVAACALGMATKEVMVSAPIVVFLYDRTFVACGFAEAWRQRRRYYSGLAATWLVLAVLVVTQHGARAAAGGFDPAVSPWTYLLKQCEAIVHYLRLTLWPDPLVVDYGTGVVRELAAVFPQALGLVVLLTASLVALRRRPVVGFFGAGFFLLLAPSSSFVPLPAQTMAEHRMYLPLGCVIAGGIALASVVLGARRTGLVVLAIAAACAVLTARRNADYRSEERIWRDTLAKLPGNWRAHYNLGWALEKQQRFEPARVELERAVALKPSHAESHAELGAVYLQLDRLPHAIEELRRALEFAPQNANARHNLGFALLKAGRLQEAADEFTRVLQQRDDGLAHLFLAKTLALLQQPAAAIPHYVAALRMKPDNAAARGELGLVYLELGRAADAQAQFEAAIRVNPQYAEAHFNLGTVHLRAGRFSDAIASYETALRLNPRLRGLHDNLGVAYARAGSREQAAAHFQAALAQDPNDSFAKEQLQALTTSAATKPR